MQGDIVKRKVGRPKEDRDTAIYCRIKTINAIWLRNVAKKNKISASQGVDILIGVARESDVNLSAR